MQQPEGLNRLTLFLQGIKATARDNGCWINHRAAVSRFQVCVQQACPINAVTTAAPNYQNISFMDIKKMFRKLHLRSTIPRIKVDPLQFDLNDNVANFI